MTFALGFLAGMAATLVVVAIAHRSAERRWRELIAQRPYLSKE